MTVIEKYNKQQLLWKINIRLTTDKNKRFWKRVKFIVLFPFIWLFYNIRDWRTALIFTLVSLIISSEVWVPYLIGAIMWSNQTLRITMFSFASACWIFWLGPGTPFLPLCIIITIGIKAVFNRFKERKKKRGIK